MFARHTIEAITALAATDAGVTPVESKRLADLLTGRDIQPIASLAYMTYREACGVTGLSVGTIKHLVRGGRLAAVMGTGGRALGIARESMAEFLKGKKKTK